MKLNLKIMPKVYAHAEEHDLEPTTMVSMKYGFFRVYPEIKGYPEGDPVDYVCLICGKWMSEEE